MPEIIRGRDCIVFFKGDAQTVVVSGDMVAGGWAGGQGVQWVDSPRDEFCTGRSSGLFGGFLLWGSNEDSDQYISLFKYQVACGHAVMCIGEWMIATRTYERYTYASRQAGPLVPLSYAENDKLVFSLRGLWTKEDEWALAGDARAPNEFFNGTVAQAPTAANKGFLTLQTNL